MTNKLDWIKKSLLGSSTMPFNPSGGHVHGPHCNHDHGHDHGHDHAKSQGHVHGPDCNHGHADDDHIHGENCKH